MPVADQTHAPRNLFALQGRCLSSDTAAAAEQIDRHGLWEYIATHSCDDRTGGAILHAFRQRNINIPTSAAKQLGAFREYVIAANDYAVSRVSAVLARLLAADVPFLLLKGAALNATVYDTPGLRSMVDIDVLIRPEDAGRVDRLLREAGCTPGPDLVQDDFYPRYYYEREYLTPGSPTVKIDLHVRPFRPMRYSQTVPDDALWDHPTTIPFGPYQVQIPSPENMLIHLCAHAACHGLGELRWLYDIKTWLEHHSSSIDLDAVADKCRRWKLSLPVYKALEKTLLTFGGPSPILIKALHRIAAPANLFDRLTLWHAPRDESHPIAHVLVNVLTTPGLRTRVGYLAAVGLPGKAHLAQLYARRHPGWTLVAHMTRIYRAIAKPFSTDPAPV